MAKFIVVADIAILDKGPEENSSRFVAIEGVNVDEYGSLDKRSLDAVKKALSLEAVKRGATRINQSDCVDLSTGGAQASNDMIAAYNGGDIIYSSAEYGFEIEKFMIHEKLLIPANKFKVERISKNGHYPSASAQSVADAVKNISEYFPINSYKEFHKIIDSILQESHIVYFTNEDSNEVINILRES
jgi:hypothetical protein